MNTSQPRALFLDLGDTLVHISPEKLEEAVDKIFKAHGCRIKPPFFDLIIKRGWNLRKSDKDKQAILGFNDHSSEIEYLVSFFIGLLRDSLGIEQPDPELVYWLAGWYSDPKSYACFDGVTDTLQKLKDRGIILGVISNAFPYADKIIEELQLRPLFEYVILSYELGAAKPDPMIYEIAAKKAGCLPEEIVFVDDRKHFLPPAREIGMQAYWFQKDNRMKRKPGSKGSSGVFEDIIQHISELENFFPSFA